MRLSKNELSILIPVYNQVCVPMVAHLVSLCSKIEGLKYEILVADDNSTDKAIVEQNRSINLFAYCRLIECEQNNGAGATRNLLAQNSKFAWLLFIDCDVELPDENFIRKYLECTSEAVINGGIAIPENHELRRNLRYMYEKKNEKRHTADKRSKHPHKAFRSTNFLTPREIIIKHPFFEPMKRYEDVYWGKTLCDNNLNVIHIDNHVIITRFDTNVEYIEKVEKDISMLRQFQTELHGYSPLLSAAKSMQRWRVPLWLCRAWHTAFGRITRNNLCGKHPWLPLLNIYKLGCLASDKLRS